MEIVHFDLEEHHKDNLRILSAFLKRAVPPPQFQMNCYMKNIELDVNDNFNVYADAATEYVYGHCGTVACAVGHGPLAGIPALLEEDWHYYSSRVFGCSHNNKRLLFKWMFSGQWVAVDNTPKGAAARIDFFLENGGYPSNMNEILFGEVSLPYNVEE